MGAAGHSVDAARWQAMFDRAMARIAGRFKRVEPRATARALVLALLSGVERKNCWRMAEQAGHARPGPMQRLLRSARWDADAVRDDIRSYVLEHLGADDSVLIVDETGFLKKGTASAGVQRQYTGTAGRIENTQVGVFLAYASSKGRALIDRRLYLPDASWCQDAERRARAGVPEQAEFATKPTLAGQMIAAALDAGIGASWVTGDEAYGQDPGLRTMLESREVGYVLAVACSTRVRINRGRTAVRADAVADRLPASAWHRQSAGAGAKGPRYYDWAWIEIGAGGHRHLLIRRNPSSGELAFYLCWSPGRVPLSELVRVAGIRWCIEECFQAAKGQVGLDHYQVRHWTSWHRHVTLVMLALAFLAALVADTTPARVAELNRPARSTDPVDLSVPGDPPPVRRFADPIEHLPVQAAALVELAQTPPGHRASQPLPATTRRPLDRIDHEVALEY